MKLTNFEVGSVLRVENGGEIPSGGVGETPAAATPPSTSNHVPSSSEIEAAQSVDDSHLDPVVDFGSLVEADELNDEPSVSVPTVPVQTPTPTAPATPASQQSSVPTPQQPVPSAVPQQPQGTPQTPQTPLTTPEAGATPAQVPQAPEQPQSPAPVPAYTPPTAEELQAQETALRNHLIQAYTLDENTLNIFDENPGQVLSTMAANLHMQVMRDVTQGIMGALPQFVQSITEGQRRGREWEDKFYARWPKLAERRGEVEQIAGMYRGLRKDLTPEKFIEEAGMHAMVLLGIPVETAEPMQSSQSGVVPQVPPTPPIQRGAPVIPGSAQPKRNLFEVLAEEDILDNTDY